MTNTRWRALAVATAAAAVALVASAPLAAHPHKAGPKDQVIANGQNHPKFCQADPATSGGVCLPGGTSCESFGSASGGEMGPAWYGLETAHHGPDAGTAGKRDGCYQTTGNVPPGQDDENPAID